MPQKTTAKKTTAKTVRTKKTAVARKPTARAKPAGTPARAPQPDVAPAPLKTKWTNQEIAALLYRIGDILELGGEGVFKVIAYRRAADSVEHLPRNLQDIWQGEPKNLRAINGIGEAIATKLDELFRTGRMSYYEKISNGMPEGLFEMMTIPGVGPQTVLKLWKELDISDINALEAAARAGKLQTLPGFGAKKVEKMLAGIDSARRKKSSTRVLLGRALPFSDEVVGALKEACGAVIEQIECTGSLRRMRATIGDVDILVASNEAEKVIDAFVHLPQVREINAQGGTKASIIAGNAMQVDLRVLEPRNWGTALQYFTGSKEHNIEVRQIALEQGLSLSEWDFKDVKTGKQIFCPREEDVYERLGMQWIPPEMREATGEVRAARKRQLPKLIVRRDLKGDLQSHSTWSDGGYSIEAMATAAKARGLHYLAVTDHSKGLGVTRGMDFDKAQQQWAEIDALNARLTDFRVLKGIEAEIRADGSLDLPDEVLARFDLVLGSTHSALGQSREQITERVIRALRNPYVDIFAHPTGRLIGSREPSALDMEEMFKVAKETGTILEINAAPERLDLSDVHARRAHELGIPIVISSDAHSPEGIDALYFGVAMARRAWLTAGDVVNTLEWGALKKRLKRNRAGGVSNDGNR